MSKFVAFPDYAKDYLDSRSDARRGVFVSLKFIDLCEGNMYDAILFSQIMYWHEPNQKGDTRLQRWHNGHLWLAKNHSDWYDECRIKSSTARKCLERLKTIGLIHYELHGETGKVTPFIRINWDMFAQKMKELDPDTTGHTPCYDRTYPLSQCINSNTETTTETTTEIYTPLPPQGDGVAVDDTQSAQPDASNTSDLDAMKEALKAIGVYGKKAKRVAQVLLRQCTGTLREYNIDGNPATVDEFHEYVKWYRKHNPDAHVPQNVGSTQTWFMKYRQAKADYLAGKTSNVMQPVSTVPYHKPAVIEDVEISEADRLEALDIMRKAREARKQSKLKDSA